MSEREPIRLGIIGCGQATQVLHLPSLHQLSGLFRVTALCDPSRQVVDGLARREGVEQVYGEASALLDQSGVEAVLVANPNPFHAGCVLASLERGIHVMVEKPMCLTLRETGAIEEARRQSGRVVNVGYMRRHAPAFHEARRRLPSLGPVRMAHMRCIIGRNDLFTRSTSRTLRGNDLPARLAAEADRARAARVEEAIGPAGPDLQNAFNLLMGLGTHDLSVLRGLLGRPRGVLAAAARDGGSCLSALLDHGGFLCHYEIAVDSVPRFDACIELFTGSARISLKYDTPYVRNLPVTLELVRNDGRDGLLRETFQPEWSDPFVSQWQAFHENITTGSPPDSPPAAFREDLELVLELVRAMQPEGSPPDSGAPA